MTENGGPPSGNTHAVVGQGVAGRAPGVVRALPDAHRGWSGPSGVNNKQLCTMDIEVECIKYISNPDKVL